MNSPIQKVRTQFILKRWTGRRGTGWGGGEVDEVGEADWVNGGKQVGRAAYIYKFIVVAKPQEFTMIAHIFADKNITREFMGEAG